MTAVVRILTTNTLDSSPAILLVSPEGNKTLINCGEGCQRCFLESSQKLSTVNRVFLSHLAYDSIGGLPGMILTTADASMAVVKDLSQQKQQQESIAPTRQYARESQPQIMLEGLQVFGPSGTQAFIHSLRHFMRRDSFPVKVREGAFEQSPPKNPEVVGSKKRKRKKVEREGSTNSSPDNSHYFGVKTIPIRISRDDYTMPNSEMATDGKPPSASCEILSFCFSTPTVVGKFLPEKAKELGIPPGPLYAKLKAGQNVQFTDSEGVSKQVESAQVVTPSSPGSLILVLYYPVAEAWHQLQDRLQGILKQELEHYSLELVIHIAPKEVFLLPECKQWRKQHGANNSNGVAIQHIYLESSDPKTFPSEFLTSPFSSACLGALTRSQLSRELYKVPSFFGGSNDATANNGESEVHHHDEDISLCNAIPMLSYTIMPRIRRGLSMPHDQAQKEEQEAIQLASESGALESARSILTSLPTDDNNNKIPLDPNNYKESADCRHLIFTGTGSAIPCKHRNVTGMYVQLENGKSMLLDIGEGTIGQLLRAMSSSTVIAEEQRDFVKVISNIQAVWISHPHADHHLGLLRLLTIRHYLFAGKECDPLILIAPPMIFRFLMDYSYIDPWITSTYRPIDCYDLIPDSRSSPIDKEFLCSSLSISSIAAIPVAHCPHSYAVVIDGTPFGRLAYSGDCRPSKRFAQSALGADLLIHEATFEDGMEAEATLKRHSTVGEALEIAHQMQAKRLVLTHFSQRYPRIPPLAKTKDGSTVIPVIFAFDFMSLSPSNLEAASLITPAVRLLYPEDGTNEEDAAALATQTASGEHLMSVPGLFSHSSLL